MFHEDIQIDNIVSKTLVVCKIKYNMSFLILYFKRLDTFSVKLRDRHKVLIDIENYI